HDLPGHCHQVREVGISCLPVFLSRFLLPFRFSQIGGSGRTVSRFLLGGRSRGVLPLVSRSGGCGRSVNGRGGHRLPISCLPFSRHFLPICLSIRWGRVGGGVLSGLLPLSPRLPSLDDLPGEDGLRHNQGGGSGQPQENSRPPILPSGCNVGPRNE